jgi:hypothetical protein
MSQGQTNQSAIARDLNLNVKTVNRDICHIRQQAQENLKTHIQETVPVEFMLTHEGLKFIIKDVYKMLDSNNLDTKNRLAALQLLTMTYKALMELCDNGTIIEQAIKKVKQLQKGHQSLSLQSQSQETLEEALEENEEQAAQAAAEETASEDIAEEEESEEQ